MQSKTLFNFIQFCDRFFLLMVPMGKQKKNEELKVVVAEYKVSMHCNACERTVTRAISKLKGLEKFMTDMNKHKVVITGRIDPLKVLKKLKKNTGKRVEIVEKKKEVSPKVVMDEGNADTGEVGDSALLFECCKDNELLMMFSDENPNACSIM